MNSESGDMFSAVLLTSVFISIFVVFALCSIAKKKGVDIRAKSFVVRATVLCILVFVIFPVWFTSIPVVIKIVITLVALAVGVANVLITGASQEWLRKIFKDK